MNSTDAKTDPKQIRKFGLVAMVFFGCLTGIAIWRARTIPIYLFGSVSLLGIGFLCFPTHLKPIYLGWLKIAHRIGRLVTTVILTLAYFLVITPTALIRRWSGNAPLPMQPDNTLSSYWVTRTESIQPKERYVKRY